MTRKTEQLTIGRRRIAVSHLDKVLYPGTKFTKADLIDYYINVSKYILPHLKNHPVTLKRFPDGVFGESFYEKDAPAFTPSWVQTALVPRREAPGSDIHYILMASNKDGPQYPRDLKGSRRSISLNKTNDEANRNCR